MSDDPIFQAWHDATNCWLAGAGLPPIKTAAEQTQVNAGEQERAEPPYSECSSLQATGESRQAGSKSALSAASFDFATSRIPEFLLKDEWPRCEACGGTGIEVFGPEPMMQKPCDYCNGKGHIEDEVPAMGGSDEWEKPVVTTNHEVTAEEIAFNKERI